MHFFPRLTIALLISLLPLSYASAQQLQCNPCSHGYGQVQIGTTKQYTFQLTNTGAKTIHILSKSKTGPAFFFGSFPLPITLRPGRGTQVTVKFKPSVTGKVTGTIKLTSDATNPTLKISVWGTGIGAQGTLAMSPASFDFGSVTIGASANLPLKLSAANGSLTISSVESSAEYTIPGLTLPLTIASGQSASISVVFTPTAAGTSSSNLTLMGSALNSPSTVPLTGVGVAPGSHSTDLSWNPSNDPVIGYNVYRGKTRGGPYNQINSVLESSTNYTDSSVVAGTTYFYVVTAMDSGNHESVYSNEVKVVIPSP